MNFIKPKLAIIAYIAMIAAFCVNPARAKISAQAEIISIEGKVEAQYGGKGDWTPLKNGSFIKAGDNIRTGVKSSCSVKWNKGNTLDLEQLTSASFSSLEKDPATETENSSVKLDKGNISFSAKKLPTRKSSYEIRTPSAVAGVRGTKGKIETDDDGNTKIECKDGLIAVKSSSGEGEVLLAAGQKTEVEKGKNPKQPAGENESEKDTTPPMLQVFQPAASFQIDSNGCAITSGSIQCSVAGMTEPGARLVINGNQCQAAIDGSFTCSTQPMPVSAANILVQAFDKAGNITAKTLTSSIDLTRVYSLSISLTPSSMVANGQNTTTVTVTTYNIAGTPVAGTVTLAATYASSPATAGSLSASAITTSTAGTGSATFNGGLCFTPNTATITAAAGGIASGAATLTLTPAVPPSPGQ